MYEVVFNMLARQIQESVFVVSPATVYICCRHGQLAQVSAHGRSKAKAVGAEGHEPSLSFCCGFDCGFGCSEGRGGVPPVLRKQTASHKACLQSLSGHKQVA